MEIIKIDTDSLFNIETYMALGNFDGVHRGHQFLIKSLIECSKRDNIKSSVLIFKDHPRNTVNKNQQPLLTSIEERYRILSELGIDYIFEIDFNREVMKMDPQDFILKLLMENLKVRGMFVGFDYRFGYKAKGDTDLLKNLSREHGFSLKVIDPVYFNGEIISSTLTRNCIAQGDITKANILLDRNFAIIGEVVHGKKLGTKMGYPTANIEADSNYIMPIFGVYDTDIYIKGKKYRAATSVGTNPTLVEVGIKIEAHILDFDEIIYGEKVRLEFIRLLRPEIAFENVETLFEQIRIDAETVKNRKN